MNDAVGDRPDPWRPIDPLGEALHILRMSGVIYSRCDFTAPWGLALPALPGCLMFHVVTVGSGWLEIAGAEPRLLRPGELTLVPHGEGHRLVSTPGGAAAGLFDLPRQELSQRYEVIRHGGGGAPTQLICGAVRFDHPAAQRLVAHLPHLIHLDGWSAPELEWLAGSLRLMAVEARALRPGGEAIITRLADILVIQAVRLWLAHDPAARTGWLAALRDEQIGQALALLHREPARPWSVASLAAAVAMSRSAFAERFSQQVGEPPMTYLARWRMQLALGWLKEDGVPIGEVAVRLGYGSEAAFSRAFKRLLGVAPGAARRLDGPATPGSS